MAGQARAEDSDDGMDEFMEKFKTQKYKKAFNESNWEEEFDKIPMFMKTAPETIDPLKQPDLACIQSIIHADDRTPEDQAQSLKDEGNEFFKEKNYKKAVVSYTEGLKKKCADVQLNGIIYTNRAAAHFHLGNIRSALNDATAAKKLKPDHLKAIVRGAQCCLELGDFTAALQWCDDGLAQFPHDKKLQDLKTKADKRKREADRDARKAKINAKKAQSERELLLSAIKERDVKLLKPAPAPRGDGDDEEDEGGLSTALFDLELNGITSQEATGSCVHLDEKGVLHWPVLFLYPEHQQTDFISSFCENSCFLDHLTVMFGEEVPPWDTDRKYRPSNLQLFFEDYKKGDLYEFDLKKSLFHILKHKRLYVKSGTPSFIVLVSGSPFCQQYLSERKVQRIK